MSVPSRTSPRSKRTPVHPPKAAGPRAAALPKVLAAALLLLAAGMWAYTTSFDGVFVGDDIDAIVNNPHVAALPDVARAAQAPANTTVAGRPLVSLSLAVNYAMARPAPLDPWGYHAFNLAVHLCAGLALFGVVRRSLLTPALSARFGARSTSLAAAIALLWLVHPLQTAAVTYVVQRAESLMGLFLLLTIYCVLRATAPGGRTTAWSAAAVSACALGMGSKEVMVAAPLLAALWIRVLQPGDGAAATRQRPLLVGLGATWLVLAALVASDARAESVGFSLGGWTWWSYLLTQAGVIVHYLRLALVPDALAFSYGWPRAGSWSAVAPQAALLVAALAATIAGLLRRHPASLLGAWFFLILAPSSSVLPIATEVAADHRMYLPLAAIVAGAVLGLYAAAARLAPRRAWPALAGWMIVAGVAAALGQATRERNRDYRSLEALMRSTVAVRPDNVKARVTYGGELLSQQRFAEAETQLRAAVSLPQPEGDTGATALAHMYLGSSLAAQDKAREGIVHLERALALAPHLGEAHALLGEAYAGQGRLADAAAAFERALAVLPDIPPLLHRVARLLATARDPAARNGAHAVRYAERAIELTPAPDWMMLDTLGAAYAEQGRFDDAIDAAGRAADAARRSGQQGAVAVLEARLALYRAGHPLRER